MNISEFTIYRVRAIQRKTTEGLDQKKVEQYFAESFPEFKSEIFQLVPEIRRKLLSVIPNLFVYVDNLMKFGF